MRDTMNQNPFDLTKATDLSDQSIYQLWVNCASKEYKNLTARIGPNSIMPKFIVGGKGCGKTHALRYFSYDVKKYEYADIKAGIKKDKYIGVLVKSEEINVHRFSEKNIPDTIWKEIFSYYFELWVARQSVNIIYDLFSDIDGGLEEDFCKRIVDIFTEFGITTPKKFKELSDFLTSELKFIDHNVNNCIFDSGKSIEKIKIKTSPGSLLFGIPAIVSDIFIDFKDLIFIYMIDQYEDFNFSKQKYINTLIRYKKNNATFWIGSRYYGIKTYETESAGEANKEDAEFVTVNLDDFYRNDQEHYKRFAEQVVINRLANYESYKKLNNIDLFKENKYFYLTQRNSSPLERGEPRQIVEKETAARQYFRNFRSQLEAHKIESTTIDTLIGNISAKDYPLIEKAAILNFYKKWNRPKDFLKLSELLQVDIVNSISNQKPEGRIKVILNHFKSDLMAQLYQEIQNPIYTYGLEELISLSWGNPRHLLTLLKKVYSWGIFNGDVSDDSAIISIKSQEAGIGESSEWLYEEPEKSIAAEPSGKQVAKAIMRLCNFLRAMRYSSKPSESSLCSFAVNMAELPDDAKQTIMAAQQLLQIVSIGMHTDKNSGAKLAKFQINRLLAPKWGLPLSSRGTISLSKEEAVAIFVEGDDQHFSSIMRTRLKRMEPPFSTAGKAEKTNAKTVREPQKSSAKDTHLSLFDILK